jgi:hypothetical protein
VGSLECARPRVREIDFATNQIVVRDGKGTTMIYT